MNMNIYLYSFEYSKNEARFFRKQVFQANHVLSAAASTRDMDIEDLPVKQTPGLVLEFDQEAFLSQSRAPDGDEIKRDLLSTWSSSFYPLDYLVPALHTAELILQNVCRDGDGWDNTYDADAI